VTNVSDVITFSKLPNGPMDPDTPTRNSVGPRLICKRKRTNILNCNYARHVVTFSNSALES
jgi:hypothetical protein